MHARPALILILLLVAPFAAAATTQTTAAWRDAVEADRGELAIAGQMNCVPEAWTKADTAECPLQLVTSYRPSPLMMTRMFDLVYTTEGVPTQAMDALGEPAGMSLINGAIGSGTNRGSNLHRASDGVIPDVIYPGAGSFEAWHGFWADTDGDGVIKHRYEGNNRFTTADSEWVWKSTLLIVGYIDPGSHPTVASSERPSDDAPDLIFQYNNGYGYMTSNSGSTSAGRFVVFTDGSLLTEMRVTGVTDPILVPDGQKPYTPRAESRVDIDRHGAAAPGPVSALYDATFGPVVASAGSPSLGYCTDNCRVGPVPLGTTFSPATEPVTWSLYAPYPQEWKAGSMSTNEAHGLGYRDAHKGWIDLVPRWGVGTSEGSTGVRPGPLAGRAADGTQAALPGYVSFELRTGLWKDIDQDGYVGTAHATDAYEGGTRPQPDNYHSTRGEYIPSNPYNATGSYNNNLRLFITPLESWGPLGVFITMTEHGTISIVNTDGESPIACVEDPESICVGHPLAYHRAGSDPIQLQLRLDPAVAGRFASTRNLFLPEGTLNGGFLACTENLSVKYTESNVEHVETLQDCDVIGKLG